MASELFIDKRCTLIKNHLAGEIVSKLRLSCVDDDIVMQHTSLSWTNYLERKESKYRWKEKGRATDNIWIEHFWKTIKYNHIYLNPCDRGLELHDGVQTYIEYYNQIKHQGIGMKPNDA